MSEKIKDFIELTRIKRPIGYMLLFWPCIWGLTLGYDFKENFETYLVYAVFFLLGSILMRSAGCIVNDIVDKKFDANVERTKNRPIASGKVSVTQGFVYASSLCLLALIVLIQFNKLTIILAILSVLIPAIIPATFFALVLPLCSDSRLPERSSLCSDNRLPENYKKNSLLQKSSQ